VRLHHRDSVAAVGVRDGKGHEVVEKPEHVASSRVKI
jgi:hypothetical protein